MVAKIILRKQLLAKNRLQPSRVAVSAGAIVFAEGPDRPFRKRVLHRKGRTDDGIGPEVVKQEIVSDHIEADTVGYFRQPFQAIGKVGVIGIEKRDPFSPCMLDAGVAGCGRAGIFRLAQDPEARVARSMDFCHLRRTVGGSVVDDQGFPVTEALLAEAV